LLIKIISAFAPITLISLIYNLNYERAEIPIQLSINAIKEPDPKLAAVPSCIDISIGIPLEARDADTTKKVKSPMLIDNEFPIINKLLIRR
jgi:hypothetical protein